MGAVRFVGRRRELALLAGLVEAVRAGVGGVVVVDGEPGIGKTALLRAGLGGADRLGCRVRWASADRDGQMFPLRLMVQCVGSPAGEAEVAGRELARPAFGTDPVLARVERLLAAVDRLCAEGPMILVAEDLQWADEASLLVWERLSQAAGQMPLLLAGSWRDGGNADLERLRRGVQARGGEAVRLGPLGSEDVAAMVAGVLGARPGRRLAELVAQAGGNPLYASELADGLLRAGRVRVAGGVGEVQADETARLPIALAVAITDRLSVLTESEMTVLRWAAVLGAEFSVRDLEVVSGQPARELLEAVESAAAAGVLDRAGGLVEFRHELIRQALYDGMPASARSDLHAGAALALAAEGAPADQVAAQLMPGQGEPDAMVICPPPAWLADWLVRNAATLMHRAPQPASALLRAAVGELGESDGRRDVLEAALASVSFLLARYEDADRCATAVLTRSADPDRLAEAGWLVGYAAMRTGRPAGANRAVAAALARPGLSGGQRARLTALLAMISFSAGDLGEAGARGAAALAEARQARDAVGAGYALHALSTVAFAHRDVVGALDMMNQGLAAIGDDPQATDLRSLLLTNKASCLRGTGQPSAAMAAARQALVVAEHAGTHRVEAARFAVAEQHDLNGDWDDALAELQIATEAASQDYLPAVAHGLSALIAGHRDDRDSMAAHLAAVADLQPGAGNVPLEYYLWRARAMAAEQDGHLAAAVQVLAPCLEPEIAERMSTRLELLPTLARLAVAIGDRELTAAAARAAQAEADADPIAFKVATANHCQGVAAGDPELVAAAASYFSSVGRPFDLAVAQEDMAALQAARGDVAAARTALGAALAAYHRLGAGWDARRAKARLSAAGVRAPRARYPARPATGWQALTATELRVAHLVAQGRSNPDIAAELFLSRSTVHTHVTHILGKLQARSRADIVREALRAAWRPATDEAGRWSAPVRAQHQAETCNAEVAERRNDSDVGST